MLIPHLVQGELDDQGEVPGVGVDVVRDRLSAWNFCNPTDIVLPLADGSVNRLDRAQLWGVYVSASTSDGSYSSTSVSSSTYNGEYITTAYQGDYTSTALSSSLYDGSLINAGVYSSVSYSSSIFAGDFSGEVYGGAFDDEDEVERLDDNAIILKVIQEFTTLGI